MKRLFIFLALLLLASVLLTACTPDADQSTEPSAALPTVNGGSTEPTKADPGDKNDPSAPPAETGAGPVETGTPNAGDPTPMPPSDPGSPETEPAFTGLQIDDGYSETVGENIGVGGN